MDERKPTFGIDFIDPLFAVAVHLGIVESIAIRPWFKDGRFPSDHEWFPFLVFLLGMMTLTLSWVGYHQSVNTKPLNGGLARFAIDVMLVVVYAVLLMQIDHFEVVMVLLVFVFALFVAWDYAKNREYPALDPKTETNRASKR